MSKNLYQEAFDKYYSLKNQYQQQMNKLKKKITGNDDLTEQEKRIQIKNIVPKCINCKKPGGTLFGNENKQLTAKCGHIEKPCDLNINITRGDNNNIFEFRKLSMELDDNTKSQIIKTKLDLLFNYSTEDETLSNFTELTEEYNSTKNLLNIINTGISDVIDNEEKKTKLDETELELYKTIINVKETIDKYKLSPSDNSTIFMDIAEIMNTTVPKLNKIIRELKYSTNKVIYDEDDDTYHLIQIPYLDSSIELDFDEEPKVTAFNVDQPKIRKSKGVPKQLNM